MELALQSSPCTLLPDPPYISVVVRSTTTLLCLAHSSVSGDTFAQSLSASRFTRLSGAATSPTIKTPVILGEHNPTVSSLRQCSTRMSTCSSDSIEYQILKNLSSFRQPPRAASRNKVQLTSLAGSALRSTSRYVSWSEAERKMLRKTPRPAEDLASRAILRCSNVSSYGGIGDEQSAEHSVQSRSSSDAGNLGHLSIRSFEQSKDCKDPRDDKLNATERDAASGSIHVFLRVRCRSWPNRSRNSTYLHISNSQEKSAKPWSYRHD
jgi:hypothetical protein